MPLVTCPDCGGDVSDQATACPNCGRPAEIREPLQLEDDGGETGNPPSPARLVGNPDGLQDSERVENPLGPTDSSNRGHERKRTDADLFLHVTRELESDEKDEALWARFLAESNYNEAIAKAKYVKARVAQLKSERRELTSESRKQREKEVGQITRGQFAFGLVVAWVLMTLTSVMNLSEKGFAWQSNAVIAEGFLLHSVAMIFVLALIAFIVAGIHSVYRNEGEGKGEYIFPRRALLMTLWIFIAMIWIGLMLSDQAT